MKKFNGKKRLKRLNGSLEWHMVGPHAFPHEVSAFIYIYWLIDWLILLMYALRNMLVKNFKKFIMKKEKNNFFNNFFGFSLTIY